MDEDDEFDELLAGIDESSLPKQTKLDTNNINTAVPDPAVIKIGVSKLHCVLVNPKQKGNPLLKGITNVPWEFDDIVPDYVMGSTTCALFLSIKYHNMNPDYIHDRLKLLGKSFDLRVLLVQIDLPDPHVALKNLTRICLLADLTLMLAWSSEDAGKIIETYKIYENKPPDSIMERVENDPHQKIVNALTSIKPVNKTDAVTLLNKFGTLANIIGASEKQLGNCPGFRSRKTSKLYKVLHEPFCKERVGLTKINQNDDDDIDITEIESILDNVNDPSTSQPSGS